MAALLAKEFVSIKIDAEKGEGPELAKRYGVRGYPTLLVVDATGEEVDRLVGYRPPKKLIAELKPVTEGRGFAALKKRVAANPTDCDAALSLGKKYEMRDDYPKAEELYKSILKAEGAPAALKDAARGRLALTGYFASQGKEAAALEEFFARNSDSDASFDQAQALFSYYQRKKDTPGVVKTGEYLLRHGSGSDAELLNNFAWYLATNDAELKKALELARKAVELSPKSAHIIDTLAEAYHRNGLHREAVETQKRAVEAASGPERDALAKRLGEFEKALAESSGKRGGKP